MLANSYIISYNEATYFLKASKSNSSRFLLSSASFKAAFCCLIRLIVGYRHKNILDIIVETAVIFFCQNLETGDQIGI